MTVKFRRIWPRWTGFAANWFARARKNFAVTASVRPPASFAPRETASITPP